MSLRSASPPFLARSGPRPGGVTCWSSASTVRTPTCAPTTGSPKRWRYGRQPAIWLITAASLPLADEVPIDGVPTGPRNHMWRPTDPATLLWTEALDGGNPKMKVPYRDRVMLKRIGGRPSSSVRRRSGTPVCNGSRREGWLSSLIMIPIATGSEHMSSMLTIARCLRDCFGI